MKRLKSICLSLGIITSVMVSLIGCGADKKAEVEEANVVQEELSIKLGVPKAPPTLPILYMLEENVFGENVSIELDMLAEGKEVLVDTQKIQSGDVVVVHMGNVVPFDGIVVGGTGAVNQASLTGEALAVTKEKRHI